MGVNVHLQVSFSCNRNESIADLALKHLPGLPDHPIEARWFLQSLSTRAGGNFGPKGGLSLWGITGNYTSAESFIEALGPFWEDLLSEVDGGPLSHEHVIVFEEREQSESSNAYQIQWDDSESPNRKIVVEAFKELPFCWNQM